MAQGATPLWRQAFDAADRTMGARVNEFARSEDFATLAALARRAQTELQGQVERASRRTLHWFNLPAASDVNRLLAQIALLEREVRELRKQLADAEEVNRRASSRSGSRARKDPA
jgi:hypothetical protein